MSNDGASACGKLVDVASNALVDFASAFEIGVIGIRMRNGGTCERPNQ